jgi:hypothetical protein
MTPMWFRRALRYLRGGWVTQHGLEALTHLAPMPDHKEHLVIDPLSGALIMCCRRHDDLFEQRCRAHAPPQPIRERLAAPVEQHIRRHLGTPELSDAQRDYLNARLGPGPRR